jgi:hypothetical protein
MEDTVFVALTSSKPIPNFNYREFIEFMKKYEAPKSPSIQDTLEHTHYLTQVRLALLLILINIKLRVPEDRSWRPTGGPSHSCRKGCGRSHGTRPENIFENNFKKENFD